MTPQGQVPQRLNSDGLNPTLPSQLAPTSPAANPQPDKFIKISTELFSALCKIRINGEARQLFDGIIRMTYGFQKKEANISTKYLSGLTLLKPHAVHKARKKLKNMNLITITQKGHEKSLTYSIQKNYKLWKVYPKKVTVPQKGYEVYPKKVTKCTPKRLREYSKDNLKITNKDNSINIYEYNDTNAITINKRKFIPPTLELLLKAKVPQDEAEKFIDFYSSKGWKVGSSPMKDWQAAARNWMRRINPNFQKPITKGLRRV